LVEARTRFADVVGTDMSRAAHDRRRASIVAFDEPEWTPPEAVVLDTSVVAEALLTDQPEHVSCDALLVRLADCKTAVVFNRLLEMELWEVVFNDALRARMPRRQLRHGRFTRAARDGAGKDLDHAMQGWKQILGTLDWQYVELHEIAEAVPDLMRSYGLQSYDASPRPDAATAGKRWLRLRSAPPAAPAWR
jgi:predicted nucleic acid-binding protein